MSEKTFSPEYLAYIASEEWFRRRALKLLLAGGVSGFVRCEVCGQQHAVKVAHVHHATYERLGEERMSDLAVLCSPCHAAIAEITALSHGGSADEISGGLLSRLRAIDDRIGSSTIGELAEIISRKRAETGIVEKDTGP